MSGPFRACPDRSVVERVIREEAANHGADFSDVVGNSNRPAAKAARTRAVERIMAETGCSHRGLEEVWGGSLRKLARRDIPCGAYDQATVARLTWQYGEARCAEIVAGRDEASAGDIAAWRQLCARAPS